MTTDTVAVWAEGARAGDHEAIMGAATPSGLPWPHQPGDMRHFREVTRGRVLIMGLNTFDKLPAILKSRRSLLERPMVVLTSRHEELHDRTRGLPVQGIPWVRDEESARWLVEAAPGWFYNRAVTEEPHKDLAVIGGPRVIELFAPLCDRLEVTHVHGRWLGQVLAPADAAFDSFTRSAARKEDGLTFVTYTKRSTK